MVFRSRYKGTCKACQGSIEVGQAIKWNRRPGQRGVASHVDCSAPNATPAGDAEGVPREANVPEDYTRVTFSEHQTPEVPGEVDLASQAIEVLREALGTSKLVAPALDESKVRELVKQVVAETVAPSLTVIVRRPDATEHKLENVHECFATLLHYGSRAKHCYLFGPHGSGKSTGAAQLAKALGRRFGYISVNPQTPESRLLGYLDATGQYRKTLFRTCYEEGGIFCIDELDNGAPSLLTTLNGTLENGVAAFPDGLVERHADFVLIGTGNTSGRGANPSYPERRPFDQAFADRFVYIEWGYDEKLELAVSLALNPKAKPYVRWVQKVRHWAKDNYTRLVPSPRISFRIAESLAAEPQDRLSLETVLDCTIWRGDADARAKVLANVPLPEVD